MNSQQRIISVMRRECSMARAAASKASAEHAGESASFETWKTENQDDGIGGPSMNPYNPTRTLVRKKKTEKYAKEMQEAYDFAVDTFLSPGTN